MKFTRFLRAFLDYTVVLMSGIASVILWGITASIPDLPVSARWTFWVAGSACLVFASFRLWCKKDEEVQKREEEIAELKNRLTNPKKQERIHSLTDEIIRGKAYLERITSPYSERHDVPESAAYHYCMEWCNQVGRFLDSELPQYLKLFRDAACMMNVTTKNVEVARSIYIGKIRVLEEILENYSATQS